MRYALALLGALLCAPVLAHSWYPAWCCSDKDCAELPKGAVTVTRTGYSVSLVVNDVPMQWNIPQADAKPSEDENFHICLMPTPGGEQPFAMRCFFAPPMGV
jgi:hypothetical protein